MAQDRIGRPGWPLASPLGLTPGEEPGLDRGVQDHIGSRLRAMYDDLRDQPVPDRFLDLLGRLDRNASEERQA